MAVRLPKKKMIITKCRCGRQLKLKDSLAGKTIRCPQCSKPVAVPTGGANEVDDDDFLDDEVEDDDYEPPARSRGSRGNRNRKRGKRSAGFEFGWRQIMGVLALGLGSLIILGSTIALINGKTELVGGIGFAILCISVGVYWIRGKTYE
ncbi:MAG: hypothetical protein H6824_24015 [Planctomycetaceae bacterium]|nr:hypothetical protein [Planctomycetaceae bacterium]